MSYGKGCLAYTFHAALNGDWRINGILHEYNAFCDLKGSFCYTNKGD